ncbi:YsnF/AvaK domain-containing protein [Persicimonas caeni]|nr:YsnF/AvaK domain-containing protein [Persicimonas caeni]
MTTTIVGLFDSEQTVHRIKNGLKDHGVSERHVNTVTWRSLSEGNDPWGIGRSGENTTAKLVDELESRGVPSTDAREFAEAVRRGGNLIITEVDDDSKADEIARYLDNQESVDLSSRREKWRETGYQGFNPNADLYNREQVEQERNRILGSGEEARITKAHEDVRVGKRDVETGGLRVHKRVKEKPVEEEVHLREEHADVRREKVDKPVKGDKDVFSEETIEVREHAEEPVVQKETRIEEELHVGKEVEEHTETIRETARETEIDIERLTEGVSDKHGYGHFESDFKQHHKSQFGSTGKDYSHYEPAYRFGHAFGVSQRYKGREYNDLEPDMKRAYEREHGEGTFSNHRDAARYGFETARRRQRS